MKNALNMCTLREVLRHGNGCPGLHEVFFGFIFFHLENILSYSNRLGSAKKKNNATKIYQGSRLLRETYSSTAPPLLEWALEWHPLTPVIH